MICNGGRHFGTDRLKPVAALVPAERAYIHAGVEQNVEHDQRGRFGPGQSGGLVGAVAHPVLERVEAESAVAVDHDFGVQQRSVRHRFVEGGGEVGEHFGQVGAAAGHDLDLADHHGGGTVAVPLGLIHPGVADRQRRHGGGRHQIDGDHALDYA